jgi:hypothetical protein
MKVFDTVSASSARLGRGTLSDPKAPFDSFKIDGVDALVELALNLHWSWNHVGQNGDVM